MLIYNTIMKKKRGEELSEEEIRAFVREYTDGALPDYQAAALLMAICFRGMTERETYVLTDAIASSGDTVNLSEFGSLSADKHSTGGVGDKTTLVVAPLAAALGCKIAKMSGRGLGHTGGTVDKLEAIPGYRTSLGADEFFEAVRKNGIAVVGQSGNLAPADKKLYALRDVTATVDSVPLIASSVMGKKLAAGAQTIVLDVKCGSGSFMKTPEEAEELAKAMVRLGRTAGRKTAALITNMDVPLGLAIGNALEVTEAVQTLKGAGPDDLTELSVALASEMAALSLGIERSEAEGRAREALASGEAFRCFEKWIAAQGGDIRYINDPTLFPKAQHGYTVLAETDAYIAACDTEKIGIAALTLGAGRRSKEDEIDPAAGIVLAKKTGEAVKRGDVLATLYTNNEGSIGEAEESFRAALTFSKTAPEKKQLIYKTVR